jgi:hypothetical protein
MSRPGPQALHQLLLALTPELPPPVAGQLAHLLVHQQLSLSSGLAASHSYLSETSSPSY